MDSIRVTFTWPGRGDKPPYVKYFSFDSGMEEWLTPMYAKPIITEIADLVESSEGRKWVPREKE